MLLRIAVARRPGRALLAFAALAAFVFRQRTERLDLLLVTTGSAQAQPVAAA